MGYTNYMGIYASSGEVENALNNSELNKPYVALVNDVIDWNTQEVDYSKMPLTFEIISGGTLNSRTQVSGNHTIEYSINGGEWTEHQTNQTGTDIGICTVKAGDIVRFRSSGGTISNQYTKTGLMIYGYQSKYNIYGNIMSLINPTDFQNLTSVPDYAFIGLFSSSNQPDHNVVSIENLVLPATTLGKYCYRRMFAFQVDINGKAPLLPATTLTEGCYSAMFDTGSNFNNSNLNYIKCLATNISYSNCTETWIRGVQTTSGTFVKPSSTDWSIKTGVNGIPENWTVQDA